MTQATASTGNGRFVLGIDAGGTWLRVVLADRQTGEIVAETTGNALPDGGPEPLLSLFASLPVTSDDIAAVAAGITKFTRTGVQERWLHALLDNFPQAMRSVVPDYVIAFHAAIPEGVGIVVIAGTGSVVYGEDTMGRAVRVGGRGWEYGDEGSGTHLTTEVIRRTLRMLDGMEEPTPLTESVCKVLGTDDPALLAEAARQRAGTEGRGFLVPLVQELAQSGDKDAINLFVGAAGWLAAWVRAAHRRLAFAPHSPIPIVGIGGLWESRELLTKPFTQVVQRWIPLAEVKTSLAQPKEGAVRLALRAVTSRRVPASGGWSVVSG